jgi:hypothetical protein
MIILSDIPGSGTQISRFLSYVESRPENKQTGRHGHTRETTELEDQWEGDKDKMGYKYD